MKHLKELVNWNADVQILPVFAYYFSRIPVGNCYRCYFRQPFCIFTLKKIRDSEVLQIILVQDFCLLETESALVFN